MKRGFNSSYIVIPIIYILILSGLLFLQFSGGTLFRTDIGAVSLSASFALGANPQEKTLSAVQVSAMGLQFNFDSKQKLVVEAADSPARQLGLSSYEKTADGFILQFEQGVQLDLRSLGSNKQQAQISLTLPSTILPLRSVHLPFTKLPGVEIKGQPNVPLMTIAFAGNEYALNLPARAYLDNDAHQLILPGDLPNVAVRIAAKAQKNQDAYERFIANQTNVTTPADFRSQIDTYLTTAYNAWKGSRYNSATGTWTHRDGENRFNEKLMVALLAEAWQRNEYTRVFTEMRNAADINPAKLTWRSAPYLGNLRRISNELVDQDGRDAAALVERLAKNDHDVLLTPKLIQFAIDRGGEALNNALRTYLDNLQASSLNATQVLGLLQQIYVWPIPDPAIEAALGRFANLVTDNLLPNLSPVNEGYFFQSSAGKSDIYNTILAARILIGAGQKSGDDRIANLGRYMIVSVLKLADDVGYLPESIDFSANAISAVSRSRGAEEFYELLSDNPAFPKEVSLFRQLGRGSWFITIATVNSVTIRPAEYNFNISYPLSRTHYLIFGGIPQMDPNEGMQLFGITWHNAPDFEIYSKGWFYNPDSRMLLIKYLDDSTTRDIKVWYR